MKRDLSLRRKNIFPLIHIFLCRDRLLETNHLGAVGVDSISFDCAGRHLKLINELVAIFRIEKGENTKIRRDPKS